MSHWMGARLLLPSDSLANFFAEVVYELGHDFGTVEADER